jgi:hypothetical protein
MLIEKQASCATRQGDGEALQKAYDLICIFAKTSQLLEEDNGKMQSHLANFAARAQAQQQCVNELYAQARLFMPTHSFAHPGLAAEAYT